MSASRLIYSCLLNFNKVGIDSELPGISSVGVDVHVNRQGEVYVTTCEPKLSNLEQGESIGVCNSQTLPTILSSCLGELITYCRALSEDLNAKALLFERERKKLETGEGNRAHLLDEGKEGNGGKIELGKERLESREYKIPAREAVKEIREARELKEPKPKMSNLSLFT